MTVDQLEQRMVLTPIDAVDAYLVHIVKEFREENEKGLVRLCLCLPLRDLGLLGKHFTLMI